MNEEELKKAWDLFIEEKNLNYSSSLNPWEMFKAGFIAGTKQNSHKHGVSGKRPFDTIPYLKTRLGNAKRALENAKDDALWTAYYTGRIELLEFIIEELSQAACASGAVAWRTCGRDCAASGMGATTQRKKLAYNVPQLCAVAENMAQTLNV